MNTNERNTIDAKLEFVRRMREMGKTEGDQAMTEPVANTSTQAQDAARSILALMPPETFRRDMDYYRASVEASRIIQGVIDQRDARPVMPDHSPSEIK